VTLAQGALVPPSRGDVVRALDQFIGAVRRAYGSRVVDLALFGSRARGDFGPFSDADVAVVLNDDRWELVEEKRRLARIAYDVLVNTGVHVQGWPVSQSAWEDPETHSNPTLVRNMRRDARPIAASS
jgi:uncharacterized protein